jgi:hypothetical protein
MCEIYKRRLNSVIIYDYLSLSFHIQRYGSKQEDLVLERPVFYTENDNHFRANRLYMAYANQLPSLPVFEENAVLVCIGSNLPMSYKTTDGCCILVKNPVNQISIFDVFNKIQSVYDRFDAWEEKLNHVVIHTGDIQEAIDASDEIFENPVFVLDYDYQYLGFSKVVRERESLKKLLPDDNNRMNPNTIANSIHKVESNRASRETFMIENDGAWIYFQNLFPNDVYAGCMKINFMLRPPRESDRYLAEYMASVIEQILMSYGSILSGEVSAMKDVFRNLLNNLPVETAKCQYLMSKEHVLGYICIKFVLSERSQKKVPVTYFCNYIENMLTGSVAFEYKAAIVTFLNLQQLQQLKIDVSETVRRIVQEMGMKAGISSPFFDIRNGRYAYRQACIAFEIGVSVHPHYSYYKFEDYALRYMLHNCLGEFPPEMLYFTGIQRLIEHDENSSTSYLKTLGIYLKNNMNITQTAKELFIHRSSFVERMHRIENLLDADLENPDDRLRINITLKLLELNWEETQVLEKAERKKTESLA